jgi:enterochelin esterase-like enzyme
MSGMRKLLMAPMALSLAATGWAAESPAKLSAPELIALAEQHSPSLKSAVESTFEQARLKDGTAWTGRGPDFFFAIETETAPKLVIDDGPGPDMEQVPESNLWIAGAHIEKTGTLHQYYYLIGGAKFGGDLNVPAFGPLSYLEPGVPSGTLSEKLTHTSKIYDGMKSDYWIYVPAQYDPQTPAAVMVFQDGHSYIDRNGGNPALNVIDNLIAQKKIPVMICVFIDPGDISASPGTPTYKFVQAHADRWHRTLKDAMRSTLYDTVSDRYVRFLKEEVLAEVGAKYNLRKDAYSHAITGLSSGGICSFNAAWQMPTEFSRVISWIGSYASIQWKEDPAIPDGGQDYPDKVLRESKHNIRVWLQDGSNDLENPNWGDWPLANLRMANALKTKDYDFHFSFGKGTHNAGHGAAEFPEEMIWLWRDYNPARTAQEFTADPEEKTRPFYRVEIIGR